MQWTMPPRVLQIVASLLGLAAVSAFVMGVLHAPQRGGRLPGERTAAAAGAAPTTAIDAADATPLANERIEGPPPPTPEELAQAKADAEAKAEADAGNSDADEDQAAPAAGNAAPPVLHLPPPSPSDTAGQTLGGPSAPDEPPH
jgi:hypothetical protein